MGGERETMKREAPSFDFSSLKLLFHIITDKDTMEKLTSDVISYLWPRVCAAATLNWEFALQGKPWEFQQVAFTTDPQTLASLRKYINRVQGLPRLENLIDLTKVDSATQDLRVEVGIASNISLTRGQKELLRTVFIDNEFHFDGITSVPRQNAKAAWRYVIQPSDYTELRDIFKKSPLSLKNSNNVFERARIHPKKKSHSKYLGYELVRKFGFRSTKPLDVCDLEKFLNERILLVKYDLIKGDLTDYEAAFLILYIVKLAKLCESTSLYVKFNLALMPHESRPLPFFLI